MSPNRASTLLPAWGGGGRWISEKSLLEVGGGVKNFYFGGGVILLEGGVILLRGVT